MKIVIAAAGSGTRMKELSKDIPKHLIPVLGKPFLYYLLENIKNAGYEEVIVIAGYRINKMKEFLDSYDRNIKLINQQEFEKEKYGSAISVACVKNIVKNEDFIFLPGDNLYSPYDLIKWQGLETGLNYIGGTEVFQPEKYGVLKLNGEYIAEIVEKPKEFIGYLINTGLYRFTPEIFSAIKRIERSIRGEFEIIDAINILAKQKKVKVAQLKDYWYDFGCPEDIKKIEQFLKND